MAKAITKKVEEVLGVTLTFKEFLEQLFEQGAMESELLINTQKYKFILSDDDIIEVNNTDNTITFKHDPSVCPKKDFVTRLENDK